MIEWALVWGAVNMGGAIAAPILGELAKSALENHVKGFFGNCLNELIDRFKPDDLKKAYGLALKEFLVLVEDKLKFYDYPEAQIQI